MTRSISTDQIKAGARLARSIYDEDGNLQYCFGFTLHEIDVERIKNSHISAVEIFSESPPTDPEKLLRDTVRLAVTRNVAVVEPSAGIKLPEILKPEKIRNSLEASDVWRGAEPTHDAVQSAAELLIQGVEDTGALLASLPKQVFGEEEAKHLLNVAIVSLAMSRIFDFPPRDQHAIVLAALLHDAGRFLFLELRNKPLEALSGFEALAMQEHPNLSSMLLRGIQPGPSEVQTAIQHHHEAFNGNGYPQGLKGVASPPGILRKNEAGVMHRYAEVLNLANDYISYVDGSYDGQSRTPLEAVTLIVEGSGSRYNPFVVLEFCSLVQRFPEGIQVNILSTSSGRYGGFSGVIREAGGTDENNPVKRILLMRNAKGMAITPAEVDLSGERHVKLRLAEL